MTGHAGVTQDPNVKQGASHSGTLPEYYASRGGPFFDILKRLSLANDDALLVVRRALVFTALAWLVPLVLSGANYRMFLSDPGTWARFLVAVGAFVLAEQHVERGLLMKLAHFLKVPLIPTRSTSDAAKALARAHQLKDSVLAEVICLLCGLAISVIAVFGSLPNTSWAAYPALDGPPLTVAGWWALFVSMPLVGFLFFRAVWRHLVWALLLRKFASFNLRLVATHPDGKGGLGFLAGYPRSYVLFVLGASSAVATAVAKHLVHEDITMGIFASIAGGWLIFVLSFFAFPLSAFSIALSHLKESSLLIFGSHATSFQRSAERKTLGVNVVTSLPEEDNQQEVGLDVTEQFRAAQDLATMLVDKGACLAVGLAALLPFAVAVVTRVPANDLLEVLEKLLLL